MKNMFLMLGLLAITGTLFSQNLLNQPESVEWDHIHNQWLVSNHATGEIVAIDSVGEQTIYSDILSSTRGLKVRGNKLYAVSNDVVVIFDLINSIVESLVFVPGAVLLNDLDFDLQGNLFVSDYWDNKIYKIDVEQLTYELFIDYGIIAPNGLIFDEEFNRMLVCGHNGNIAVIHSFDVDTAETELLLYPNFYSLDGFARDMQGDIYISSWHTDVVYKFDGNNINNNVEVTASGFNDPADIFINPYNNILAVPNFSENTVTFVQLEIPSSNEENNLPVHEYAMKNYPNPFNPNTNISFELTLENRNPVKIEIFNLKGQKIRSYSIQFSNQSPINSIIWNGNDQSGRSVSSGIYYAVLKQDGKKLASTKMILMK